MTKRQIKALMYIVYIISLTICLFYFHHTHVTQCKKCLPPDLRSGGITIFDMYVWTYFPGMNTVAAAYATCAYPWNHWVPHKDNAK